MPAVIDLWQLKQPDIRTLDAHFKYQDRLAWGNVKGAATPDRYFYRFVDHQVQNVHKYIPHKKLNSVALVRERTIPAERPPLVSEVSANFCG
jgi:hypothetical protein